jgi:hypothetical protein
MLTKCNCPDVDPDVQMGFVCQEQTSENGDDLLNVNTSLL